MSTLSGSAALRTPVPRLTCLLDRDVDTPRLRRVMRQILAMVGLPARITSDPGDGQTFGRLRVVSAAKQRTSTTEAASLEIPVGSPWDRPGDVRVAWIDSIPVLYLGPLGKPAQVIEAGRLGFDVVRATEYLLEGEQHVVIHRDALGRFRPSYSILDDLGLQYVAPVARYATLIRRWFLDHAPGLEAPSWGGARFLVALSHDLDGVFDQRPSWRKAVHLLRTGTRALDTLATQAGLVELARIATQPVRAWSGEFSGQRFFAFDRWSARETDLGVRATFHVFGDYEAGRDPRDAWYGFRERGVLDGEVMSLGAALARLEEQGHEVGLHASVASFDQPARLEREVATIERALGRRPASVRCHYLRFDQRMQPARYAAAGLRYDSSIGALGFPRGTAFPFEVPLETDDADGRITEIPTVVMDDLLLKDWQLGLSEELARRKIERIIQEVRETEGAVSILFHPDSVDKLGLLSWVVRWIGEQGGRCVPVAEVGRLWAARTDMIG